jgi:hypothetical protein
MSQPGPLGGTTQRRGDERAPQPDDYRKVYAETNNNFRTLTEIRFKLLAFLPLGTGLGVIFTKREAQNAGLFVFGAIITIALWVYDQRNNQYYDELVAQAAELERRMGIFGGPFDAR